MNPPEERCISIRKSIDRFLSILKGMHNTRQNGVRRATAGRPYRDHGKQNGVRDKLLQNRL